MKKLLEIVKVLISFILILFLFGCNMDNPIIEVSGILIDSTILDDEYEMGDFDLEDLNLTIEHSDNSTTTIALDSSMISSEDLTKLQTVGTHDITINYEGFSQIISVTIIQTPTDFTVTFDGDGGTLVNGTESQQITYGEGAIAPTYFKDYYDFTGWDISFDNITDDITIIAQWQIWTYLVTFDIGDGTIILGQGIQIIDHGADAVSPTIERIGYDFDGWNISYQNITATTTLTALWKTKILTVTFDGNGGTLVNGTESQQITYGEGAVAPTYSKECNDFIQWDVTFDNVTEDITVTAQWQPDTYTVNFRTNIGYLVSGEEDQTIDHNSSAIPPVYIRDDGYTLIGWTQSYDNITEDTFIIALWERNQYTVTFTLDGGTVVSGDLIQDIYHFDSAIPPVLEKTGYVLYKWETSVNVLFWDMPYNNITETITINPIWIEIIAPTPGLTFQAVGDNLEVSGYTGSATTVFIPSYYDGKWVVGIGYNALANNSVIEELTLQYGIEYIEFQGLAGLSNMHTLNLSDTLYFISSFGLSGAANLTQLIIPASLDNIGYGAINEMHSMIAFVVDENNTAYKTIDGILYTFDETTLVMYPGARVGDLVLPLATTTINDSAFSSCALIKTITFNQNISSIPLLQSCESLTAIFVHQDNENFQSIDGILYNKTATTLIKIPRAMSGNVTIPATVTSIAEFGCSEAYNLSSIRFLSTTPPIIEWTVFNGLNQHLVIYVPADSINDYKSASGWIDIESYIR